MNRPHSTCWAPAARIARMFRAGRQALLLAAVLAVPFGLGASRLWADWYLPYTAPTMDTTIYSSCLNTLPAPTTRTDIGIGESVNVWIRDTTFTDVDCRVTPEPAMTVPDSIGKKVYTLSKEFNGLSGIRTGDAASLTIQAALLSTNGTGTVSWVVYDSGTHPNASESINLGTKTFNIKVPASMSSVGLTTQYLGPEPTPGGSSMAQAAYYYYQVNPVTVNFKNCLIMEIITPLTFNWPDGSSTHIDVQPAGVAPRDTGVPGLAGTKWNIIIDDVSMPLVSTSKLLQPGGTTINALLTDTQYWRFQDQNGAWITYYNWLQSANYRATDFKANSNVGAQTEPWRGPFP